LRVRVINSGSIFSTTRPGRAEPPPRRRATLLIDLPKIATKGFGIWPIIT
jgi:hypothetical protein